MATTGKRSRIIGCLLTLIILTAGSAWAESADTPVLTNDDCVKCHSKPPADIAANGSAHKTEVTCQDCHEGHPPSVQDNIPLCSKCHTGTPHFELEGCLGCHQNPHTPLAITLPADTTQPCLTCHTDQMEQLQQHQSKHTLLACTTCHQDWHPMVPECRQCHSPHAEEMTQNDCLACHRPHMPKDVAYPEEIPSKFCGACHDTAYNLLAASNAKHHELACAFCHQNKHKTIPQCQDCHGVPHPDGMMAKFTACGDCHGIAHNLNK